MLRYKTTIVILEFMQRCHAGFGCQFGCIRLPSRDEGRTWFGPSASMEDHPSSYPIHEGGSSPHVKVVPIGDDHYGDLP